MVDWAGTRLPIADIASALGMAMLAMGNLVSAQSTKSVELLVSEALQGGGNGLDINALLNALPGPAGGTDLAPQIMASLGNGFVPSWDTGHGGGFTFAATNAITTEALVLHHDAIQPIANG